MHVINFSHGGASCKLVPWDQDVYILMSLWSKFRGEGHASALMAEVINWADEHRATIFLGVQRYGPPREGMNNAELIQFYSRYGFVIDERVKRNRQMIRYYSQEKHAS